MGGFGSLATAGAWWLVAPFPAGCLRRWGGCGLSVAGRAVPRAPWVGGGCGVVGRCVSPSQAGHTALAWYTVRVLRDRSYATGIRRTGPRPLPPEGECGHVGVRASPEARAFPGPGLVRGPGSPGLGQSQAFQGRGAVSICGSAAWARPATTNPHPTTNPPAQPPEGSVPHERRRLVRSPRLSSRANSSINACGSPNGERGEPAGSWGAGTSPAGASPGIGCRSPMTHARLLVVPGRVRG